MVLKGDMKDMSVSWLFNGAQIDGTNNIKINNMSPRISGISIDPVTIRHIGNYSCVAQNQAGRKEYSASLNINGTRNNRYLLLKSFPFLLYKSLT